MSTSDEIMEHVNLTNGTCQLDMDFMEHVNLSDGTHVNLTWYVSTFALVHPSRPPDWVLGFGFWV